MYASCRVRITLAPKHGWLGTRRYHDFGHCSHITTNSHEFAMPLISHSDCSGCRGCHGVSDAPQAVGRR